MRLAAQALVLVASLTCFAVGVRRSITGGQERNVLHAASVLALLAIACAILSLKP